MKKLTLVLLTLLCLTSCGDKGPKKTAHLHLNIGNEPQTLDPRKARSLNDINVLKMLSEGLTRTDETGKASLALAESVEITNHNKTYTFQLKDSKWSDDSPLTSHDFLYAWKTALSPTFPSPTAYHLFGIKNAKAIKEGKLPQSMLGVKTPNDKTLVIELAYPIPYFLDLLSHPIAFPVPTKLDQSNPKWPLHQNTYVSNGPFKMKSWLHSDMIELSHNEAYHDQANVKLAAIDLVMVPPETEIRMFETHELDWAGSPLSNIPPDELAPLQEKNLLSSLDILGTMWININTKRPPFDQLEIRQMLSQAIDRPALIEHVLQSNATPAHTLVPSPLGLSSSLIDVKESLELSDIDPIILTYAANERSHRIAQAIQDQWVTKLNLQIQLRPLEPKVYFEALANHDYDLAFASWQADFQDPINFLEVFKNAKVPTNATGWENSLFEEGLEESYYTSNPAERQQLLEQMQNILMKDQPIIPIYHHALHYVKHPRLQGVHLSPCGIIDFKHASIMEKK